MIKQRYNITSLENLSDIALQLLSLTDNRIFAFYGTMGVGKTTLIKYLCKHLKVIDSISSPTFSIVNEYINMDGDKIFHFDFYRLQNLDEADKIGFETYINSGNYCFIEWPDLIESLLPNNHHVIKIQNTNYARNLSVLK